MDRQTSLEAVIPDVIAMRTLQENISRLLGSDTGSLLPSVREKLNDLLVLIRETDVLLSDHVLRGLIMLNNQPWQDLLQVGDSASGQRSELEKDMEEDLLRVHSRLVELSRDNGRQEAILKSLSWRLPCTQALAVTIPMSSRLKPSH